MKKFIIIISVLMTSLMASDVYSLTLNEKTSNVYPKLIKAFKKNHLIIVSEIDILNKFRKAGLPKKFGSEFNTKNLTAIKAVIACNGFYGNYIANADPEMLALCPVRVTLIEKNGKTTLLFVKPTSVSKNSKAYNIIRKLESKVIYTLNSLKR